jgi:hypothetical protein
MVTIGAGDIVMLWGDVWNEHHTLTEFPRLYSYAKTTRILVAQYLNNLDVHHNFHTPISPEVSQELTTLNLIILEAQGNQHNRDIWTYIWGTSQYSSSKFYTLNFASIVAHAPFKWIWKSKVSKKIKIFIWLLFRDRINSRSLLRRKNYKIDRDDYSCVLCNLNVEELSYHLIFQCPFNYECWDYLGINWDHSLQFFDTIWKAKQDSHIGLFMEVFSITAWEIWR